VRKLEAKGLIRREVDTADTRARRLRVTGRGAEVAVQAIAAVEAADARFFEPVPGSAAVLALLRPLAHRDDR
jgi:DNA-binding MarR family transcriptional regulator